MALPELTKPAELYYDEEESRKYNRNGRILKIQREMTDRAVDMLGIEGGSDAILDLGCGSGISGRVLAGRGYPWVGLDISPHMLRMAGAAENGPTGRAADGLLGPICADMGAELPFGPESFKYAVSISAVQWLFQSYRTEDDPTRRIKSFFCGLYRVVSVRAVIQFYCSEKNRELLRRAAMAAGFIVDFVIENQGRKDAKMYLILDKCRQRLASKQAGTPAPHVRSKRAKVE